MDRRRKKSNTVWFWNEKSHSWTEWASSLERLLARAYSYHRLASSFTRSEYRFSRWDFCTIIFHSQINCNKTRRTAPPFPNHSIVTKLSNRVHLNKWVFCFVVARRTIVRFQWTRITREFCRFYELINTICQTHFCPRFICMNAKGPYFCTRDKKSNSFLQKKELQQAWHFNCLAKFEFFALLQLHHEKKRFICIIDFGRNYLIWLLWLLIQRLDKRCDC